MFTASPATQALANEAICTADLQDVKRGLAALILEDARHDMRQSLTALCLLYNSARKFGLDPDNLLRRSAPAGIPQMQQFIEGYVKIGEKDLRKIQLRRRHRRTRKIQVRHLSLTLPPHPAPSSAVPPVALHRTTRLPNP